ncbi:MAG: hypothetical protein KDA63_08595 [Planctomycetales bacterium]|nr:hypothetical protein [Planctomycetales bacterium]
MKILPLYPLAAAPNLALTLARIARTPRARLGLILRLQPRCHCAARWYARPLLPCPADNDWRNANNGVADIAPTVILEPKFPRRNLGEALLVDRLVTGVILGSELDILGCEAPAADMPCAAPQLDVWA